MTNLLEETLDAIEQSSHKPADIVFIGSQRSGHECTWEEFEALADHGYDASYGAAEVATDLIIVFDDGQMLWRGEYDGSEWWEYRVPFERPETKLPLTGLFTQKIGWDSCADIAKQLEVADDKEST